MKPVQPASRSYAAASCTQGIGHQGGGGREHHVRRHRGADDQVDVVGRCAGVLERSPRRGQRDVGERLVLRDHPALADARPLEDPLVRGVDVLREIVVRHDAVGDAHAEPGDPDADAVCRSDHRSTAKGQRATGRQIGTDVRRRLAAADRATPDRSRT
jgi:hypothetical protein